MASSPTSSCPRCLHASWDAAAGARCSQGRGAGKLGDRGGALRHPALLGCRVSTGSPKAWGALIYSFQTQCTGWWVLSCRVPITKPWRKPQFWLPWGCNVHLGARPCPPPLHLLAEGLGCSFPGGFWVLLARAHHQILHLPFPHL